MTETETTSRIGESPGEVLTRTLREPQAGAERSHKAWTKEQDEYVRVAFRNVETKEIAARLDRTPSAVYQRALKFLQHPKTRSHPPWEEWETDADNFMRGNYGKMQTKQLAAALGRTIGSIQNRAVALGLTRPTVQGPKRPWSEEDERYVLAGYGKIPTKAIAGYINRTRLAVYNRASHPRWGRAVPRTVRRKWEHSEDNVLRFDYGKLPTRSICRALSRTLSSVNCRAHKLGLTRPTAKATRRDWTEREDECLLANYGEIRPSEIAKKLGRTRASVYHRAEQLGLSSKAGSPELLRRRSLPRTARPFRGFSRPADIGYVAGILDGEGTVLGPPRVTIRVSMTSKEAIDRLHSLCGGTATGPYENRSGKSLVCKPQYHWTVSSAENAFRILKDLLPYLVVKKEKAEEVLRFLEAKWFP